MEDIQEIQDIINEMELSQQPIKEIAHYTSIEALNGIINGIQTTEVSKTQLFLRATHIQETDDPEELQEGIDFLMEVLSVLEEGLPEKFKLTNFMTDVKSSNRYKNLSEEDIKKWFFSGIRTPYIISFARYINQLAMWQSPYARNGEGACLVFNFSSMNYSNDQLDIQSPIPIIYGKRLGYLGYKNAFLNLIWKELIGYCNRVNNVSDIDAITLHKLQTIEPLYAFVASYFKREKWHNQQEIRIVCTTKDEHPSCVMTDEKNRKYVEAPVPTTCLKQVILGPKVHDSHVESIREKLAPLGFTSKEIFKSKEPLR